MKGDYKTNRLIIKWLYLLLRKENDIVANFASDHKTAKSYKDKWGGSRSRYRTYWCGICGTVESMPLTTSLLCCLERSFTSQYASGLAATLSPCCRGSGGVWFRRTCPKWRRKGWRGQWVIASKHSFPPGSSAFGHLRLGCRPSLLFNYSLIFL